MTSDSGIVEDNVWADVEEVGEYNPYPYDTQDEEDTQGDEDEQGESISHGSADVDDTASADEESGENEDGGGDSVEEEDGNINVAYFLANALKEKGIIDVDVVDKNISDEDVISLYSKAHEERIRYEEESRLIETLQSRGITEDNLAYAMAIQNGYSPDMLLEQNRIKALSQLPDDTEDSLKEAAIIEFRRQSGWAEDEIEDRMQDLILNEDKLGKEFDKARGFFAERKRVFDDDNHRATLERERVQQEVQERNRRLITNIYTTGKIKDETMTSSQLEAYKKALSDQSNVVEIDGRPYRASKFDKFIHEFQNDLETQLLVFKLMMFRDEDIGIATEEAGNKREDSIFKALQQRITKSSGAIPKEYTTDGGRKYERSKTAREIIVR